MCRCADVRRYVFYVDPIFFTSFVVAILICGCCGICADTYQGPFRALMILSCHSTLITATALSWRLPQLPSSFYCDCLMQDFINGIAPKWKYYYSWLCYSLHTSGGRYFVQTMAYSRVCMWTESTESYTIIMNAMWKKLHFNKEA